MSNPAADRSQTQSTERRKILVIEDAATSASWCASIWRPRDCGARGGRRELGLALVKRERPAAVILDLMLPGLGGLEAYRRIRGSEATSRVPVVILTARSAEAGQGGRPRDRRRRLRDQAVQPARADRPREKGGPAASVRAAGRGAAGDLTSAASCASTSTPTRSTSTDARRAVAARVRAAALLHAASEPRVREIAAAGAGLGPRHLRRTAPSTCTSDACAAASSATTRRPSSS